VWEYRLRLAGGGAPDNHGRTSVCIEQAIALGFTVCTLQQTVLFKRLEATAQAARLHRSHEPCVCDARTSPSPPTRELFCLSCTATRPAPKARPKSDLEETRAAWPRRAQIPAIRSAGRTSGSYDTRSLCKKSSTSIKINPQSSR
jgi:hypothetical protein